MPEEEKTSIQPTGAVMDVQAPKAPTAPTAEPAPAPTTDNMVAAPAAMPSPTPEAAPVATPEAVVAPEATPATAAPEPSATESKLGVPLGSQTAHRKRKPIIAIICAVVVALILAGLTVYAFQKSKAKKPQSPPATQVETLKASDLDQLSSDLDATLQKADDAKDLATTDLNDATLGL